MLFRADSPVLWNRAHLSRSSSRARAKALVGKGAGEARRAPLQPSYTCCLLQYYSMDFESKYEITSTASLISEKKFRRVALQFPDELLKDAAEVVSALRNKLKQHEQQPHEQRGEHVSGGIGGVSFFVMADTTFGSCCVDEVGASHVDADCVVHYGRTCMSLTSTLPAFFVFGKSLLDAVKCAENLHDYCSKQEKPVLVTFGLEYGHAIKHVRDALSVRLSTSFVLSQKPEFQFAEVICPFMNPKEHHDAGRALLQHHVFTEKEVRGATNALNTACRIGGLTWNLPRDHRIEDYLLIWIGTEDEAFSNIFLTFSGCDVVRYDTAGNCFITDFSQQRRILKRRYYLVERAKDANIIGILVGTLSVAGYIDMINQMKELIARAGKKAYTLVMGRPNPAKLANFPECDVFIYVSCAQTALFDSKEYLAPVITPFEAVSAFDRGRQWTGAYVTEFQSWIPSSPTQNTDPQQEARYSFLQGGYVEDFPSHENGEEGEEATLALVHSTERALQVRDNCSSSLITTRPSKSGAEFFAARTYRGLEERDYPSPERFLIGRTGKASGYEHEIVR